MRTQATLLDFIAKAQAIHGENYSYTQYDGALTKIDIYCVKCAKLFSQLPSNHLSGRGCPRCAQCKSIKNDRNSFIERARSKHDSKFEYIDLPDHVKQNTKIKLRCLQCDITFEQWVKEHLKGRNSCPGCGPRTMTQSRFIREATELHSGRYNYSQVAYTHTKTYVIIKCLACDLTFVQRPSNHLNGDGCPSCGNKRKGQGLKREAYERFLEHTRLNREKYDYSRAVYASNKVKMLIGCLKCGEDFEQTPLNHVAMKQGCPRCAKAAFVSRGETAWLDSLNIPTKSRNCFITTSNDRKINVDAYHDEVIYEFYGRYWHGDPRTTDQQSIHAFLQIPMREVYANTIERHKQIVASGYEILFVWEDDHAQGMTFSKRHPHEELLTP